MNYTCTLCGTHRLGHHCPGSPPKSIADVAYLESEIDRLRAALDEANTERAKAEAEWDHAVAQVQRIAEAAEIPFRGSNPKHTNAWHLEGAARKLEDGYPVGGSNVTAAVARVLRAVAAALAGEGSEQPGEPHGA